MPVKKRYPKYAAIYIPSKDKLGKSLSPRLREKAIKSVRNKFRSWIGGSTSKSQEKERIFKDTGLIGEFDPSTGGFAISEEVTLIYGYYTEDEAVSIPTELTELAEEICRTLDQYCIGVIIDREFQLIEPD